MENTTATHVAINISHLSYYNNMIGIWLIETGDSFINWEYTQIHAVRASE